VRGSAMFFAAPTRRSRRRGFTTSFVPGFSIVLEPYWMKTVYSTSSTEVASDL